MRTSSKYSSFFKPSDKEGYWKCLKCGAGTGKNPYVKIEATGSTSGRLTHLKRHHPQFFEKLKKEWAVKKQRREDELLQFRMNQPSHSSFPANLGELVKESRNEEEEERKDFMETSSYSNDITLMDLINGVDTNDELEKRIDRGIVEFIARDLKPFQTIDGFGFIELTRMLDPGYTVKPSDYYKNAVLLHLYMEMRERMKLRLATASSALSFSIDASSDESGHWWCFVCRVHFIDSVNTLPVRFVIGVLPCTKENRTTLNVSRWLDECFDEFGIDRERIQTLVTDCANSIYTSEIGIPVAPCYVDSLHQSIKQGLKILGAEVVIEKLKKILREARRNTWQNFDFVHYVAECNASDNMLFENAEMSWTSVYDIASRFLSNNIAIRRFFQSRHNSATTSTANDLPILSDDDWSQLIKIKKLLEPLIASTKVLYSQTSAQLSAVIPTYQVVKEKLERAEVDELTQARGAILNDCKWRIRDYFDGGSLEKMIYLSTLLDPRFKDRFFRNLLSNPKEYLVNVICKNFAPRIKQEVGEELVTNVDDDADDTMDEFAIFARVNAQKSACRELPISGELKQRAEQEVRNYLDGTIVPSTSDPFEFWKLEINQLQFPKLFEMSKVYLSSPATSVEDERLFAEADRNFDDLRKSLPDTNLKQLLFIHFNYDRFR